MRTSALFLACGLGLAVATPAHASEGFDGCSGYIDAVPAVVTKPGVWCLRANLETASTSGAAITVSAHNVTIDCNDYSLRGNVSPASSATGIYSSGRNNVIVTACHLRGFNTGVSLTGFDQAVLDSHFELMSATGIYVQSTPGLVRGNRVTDIGLADERAGTRGIRTIGDVDILDNTVDRVRGASATARVLGIYSQAGQANVVARNRVLNVENTLAGGTSALTVGGGNASSRTVVRDNQLLAASNGATGTGLNCMSSPKILSRGNQIAGWTTPLSASCVSSDDAFAP